MEWVESTGTSIEEAKERALDRLGVHEDDAEFEVVSDVKVGLFGRVKEEARVRARVAPSTPRAKEERRRGRGRGGRGDQKGSDQKSSEQKGSSGRGSRASGEDARGQGGGNRASGNRASGNRGQASRSDASSAETSRSEKHSATSRGEKRDMNMNDDEPTMPLAEQADLAEAFVAGLAERFGTTVVFSREDVEDDEIRITVSGDDLGRMIGRRGTTAGAIDELVRTVLQRQAGSSRNGRIRVDVGGVRARRAEALANFSRAQAEEVRTSGKARSLEPMSAADRKVVHDALADEDGVETRSEGEDSQRRVVIVPAGDDD